MKVAAEEYHDKDTVEQEVEEEEKELLVIRPSTSASSSASVITLGSARFLDVRKSLLLRKALVEDPKQDVVVVCSTPTATSCIRPTSSAVNDCEPD